MDDSGTRSVPEKLMIKNAAILRNFEKELIRKEPVDVAANFRIIDALYQEAAGFGIFPLKEPLAGLETTIRIAKVVNGVPEAACRHNKGTE